MLCCISALCTLKGGSYCRMESLPDGFINNKNLLIQSHLKRIRASRIRQHKMRAFHQSHKIIFSVIWTIFVTLELQLRCRISQSTLPAFASLSLSSGVIDQFRSRQTRISSAPQAKSLEADSILGACVHTYLVVVDRQLPPCPCWG